MAKEKKKETIFEKVETEVIDATKSYVENKIKKKVIKFGEFSVMIFLAMVLISIGLAELLGFYFPQIPTGLNYIIIGILFLAIGFLIKL